MKFRALEAKDVECRVCRVTQNGVQLLLYKNARVDMNLLDETVGPMNWQRKHEFKNGLLYCSVGIWDEEKKQWIWKEDVGTESFTEKEKGQASDAFKRSCFNLGIGRELYTAPFIWVKNDKCEIEPDKSGKPQCKSSFRVTDMKVNEGQITGLTVCAYNRFGKLLGTAFKMENSFVDTKDEQVKKQPEKANNSEKTINEKQVKLIWYRASDAGVQEKQLKHFIGKLFNKEHLNELTKPEMDKLLDDIERFKKSQEKTA